MPGNPYYQTAHWRQLKAACFARDGYRCVVPGCGSRAKVADHKEPRPPGVTVPCAADHLDNLRSLCGQHDAQVKEQRRGDGESRKSGGRFTVKGCDDAGRSLDPGHPWNR